MSVQRAHYVYRCFDADGDLIYIGCTSNVKRRLSSHRSSRAVASRLLSVFLARHEVEGPFPDRATALEAERTAIQVEQPLFNRHHRAGLDFATWMTRSPIAAYLIEPTYRPTRSPRGTAPGPGWGSRAGGSKSRQAERRPAPPEHDRRSDR